MNQSFIDIRKSKVFFRKVPYFKYTEKGSMSSSFRVTNTFNFNEGLKSDFFGSYQITFVITFKTI